MDPAFSRRGEPATAFERELVQRCQPSRPETEQELWMELSRRIGLDELLLLFDMLGARKVWVPSRETFVRWAWVDLRDAEIRRLRTEGRSLRSIAAAMGVDNRTVTRVLHRGSFGATPERAKQRA
jgi:hypothetical protein